MPKPRPTLFKWRRFEPEIIICAVRWYLRSLSYRDVEELFGRTGSVGRPRPFVGSKVDVRGLNMLRIPARVGIA